MTSLVLACTGVAVALCGQQGTGATPNIAVVNLTGIFERYQMTRDLEQVFEERRQKVATDAKNKRENINMMRNALLDIRPGTADFVQREEDLITAEIGFQAWLEIQERRLKKQHTSWLRMIYKNTQNAIARIAQKSQIDLVLTYNDLEDGAPDSASFKQQILLRSVIYASERTNLTESVIEMLDTEYRRSGGVAELKAGAPPATKLRSQQ